MASNVLGRIAVTLGLDSAAFEQGLSKAAKQANANAKEIEKGFKSLGGTFDALLGPLANLGGQVGSSLAQMGSQIGSVVRSIGPLGGALGGVGVAAASMGAGLVAAGTAAAAMAIKGADMIERLNLISEKTGISTHNLQVFEAAGSTVGLSLEQMVTAMRKFDQAITGNGKNAAAAQAVLKSLGITATTNREAILQAADAFQKMEDGPRKAADAVALFGRSGLDMIPLLDKGRAGILAFDEAVSIFGPHISAEGVKAVEDWRFSTEKLDLVWKDFENRLAETVLPTLAKLASLMAEVGRGSGVIAGTAWTALGAALTGKFLPGAVGTYLGERTAETGQSEPDKTHTMHALEQEHFTEVFEREKDVTQAQYNLQMLLKQIEEARLSENMKLAASLELQVPAMEKIAAAANAAYKEAQREAEVRARGLAELEVTHGAVRPGAAKSTLKPGDTSGLFGAQPSPWDVLAGEAPSIGGTLSAAGGIQVDTSGLSLLTSLTEQYKSYLGQTTQEITAYWDSQIKAMNALLLASHASQEVIDEMNKEANALKANALAGADTEAMKAAKAAVREGTATFQQAWQVAFDNVKSGGAKLTQTLGTAFGNMLNDINHGLAELIVTGKGLNFKEIAQKFGVTMVQSLLQKGESSILGALGFGRPDGSSNNPFYVTPVGADGTVGSLAGGGGIGSIFGGGLGPIMNLFGGFLAGGGDVTPGHSYIVGDSGPELFTPSSAGSVTPNAGLKGSSSTTVNYIIDARGADAGVEQRVRTAIRDSENRAVARSVSTVNELSKRR